MGRTRKRSAAISLVLAGSAALSGCGDPESQRDVYTKLDDCSKDWGNPTECEPVGDGRYSNTYFYGPRYYGASYPSGRPRASANAIEAAYAGRGGVTRIAGNSAGSGSAFRSGTSAGAGSAFRSGTSSGPGSSYAFNSGSSVSRSGFGSSAHASSGGG